jgi:ABC-type amino acid transport substrate-binding protein
VAAGKVDAFLCSQPVGAEAIAKGGDLRMLDTPAFYTYKTGYIDRSMTLAPQAFLAAIDGAIRDLEASGDLKTASMKYFATDYVTAAAAFDMAKINQTVP